MKGGVILFRGAGTDARSYLESDRSRADEYYLEGGVSLAEFSAVDGAGEVVGEGALTPEQYADWVDWINPFTASRWALAAARAGPAGVAAVRGDSRERPEVLVDLGRAAPEGVPGVESRAEGCGGRDPSLAG